MKSPRWIAALGLALLTGAAALADNHQPVASAGEQSDSHLQVTLVSEKEIVELNEEGEEVVRRVPVEVALPGDEIIYTIRIENTGAEPASDVVVVNPVPPDTAYVESSMFTSITGAGVRTAFSADGGQVYLPRGDLKVMDQTGEIRGAVAADITHIRWQVDVPLPAGKSALVGYRVVVK